jgi:hypothetical protein
MKTKRDNFDLNQIAYSFKGLNSPAKIQDFINNIPVNFEENGETCYSPASVLENNKCHCIEGAFLAAACIWLNNIGEGKPLVVDMKGEENDCDHVIAIFRDKKTKKFGAISKTNHPVLRYREPVYKSIRELIMSFFHEYSDNNGNKTLREFSWPIDLSIFGKEWITSKEYLWHIHDYIGSVKHFKILDNNQKKELRKQDDIEIKLDSIVEWPKPEKNLKIDKI